MLHVACFTSVVVCFTSVVVCLMLLLHVSCPMLQVLNKGKKWEYSRPFYVWCRCRMFDVVSCSFHMNCYMLHILSLSLHVWRRCCMFHVRCSMSWIKTKIRNIPDYSQSLHVWCQHCMFYVVSCRFHVKRCMLHIWRPYCIFYVKCCMSSIKPKIQKIPKYSHLFHVNVDVHVLCGMLLI